MRRFAPVALAVLLSFPIVGPAAAADPTAAPTGVPTDPAASDTPAATPTPAAEPSPSAEPTPLVAPPPTPAPPPAPTPSDPATTPTPPPSSSPSPTPSATPADAAPAAPEAAPPADRPPTPDPEPATDAAGRPITTGRYIVMLDTTADTAVVTTRHRQRDGIRADRTFSRAIRGFTAKLDKVQRKALLDDPNVVAVVPDEVISVAGQVNPTGVSRVGARKSTVASINNVDDRVDADVAIVDTGVYRHPDLNVVGGVNCTTTNRAAWADGNGHGTHVAGTVAALDNDFGVVGVAPGARIWAVRILNSDGYGLLSWYVCGLDWILGQKDPLDASRPLIEAVNMSVAKSGADDANCGITNKDVLHQAICRLYRGGITVVAAAANERRSASHYIPASYNEVITTSALADTDGRAGGLGGNLCYSWGTYDKDDTFADFSNYGWDVDLIAPGKCIWSTLRTGGYGYSSGTSMAAPAVTGAVALYKASRPMATPAEVRESLRYLGNYGWATSTDPDTSHEPLLDVSRLGRLGTFGLSTDGSALRVPSAGATFDVPLTISRSATFFERVRLSVSSVPSGWTVGPVPTSVYGWTATKGAVRVTVPSSTPAGRYDFVVTGTNWGRSASTTITVDVSGDMPTAYAPRVSLARSLSLGRSGSTDTYTVQAAWPAATDPSDAIVSYQAQLSTNGGAWGRTVTLAGTARAVRYSGLRFSTPYDVRVRAQDKDGDWSLWAKPGSGFSTAIVGDRSTRLTYRGTWRKVLSSSATNGTLTASTSRGAFVRHVFTGKGVALVAPLGPGRGRAGVYVDGVYRATIDLKATKSYARRVVYAIDFGATGTHSIELRVLGTSGRPTVALDAVVILR
ncbi:MAG TPA: S8 family serine peptidase [Candidatus Limnocylindrales bacterium]|nr:S8 family serine peptidase [Candidatus Limnocylindrales bacterium]